MISARCVLQVFRLKMETAPLDRVGNGGNVTSRFQELLDLA